MTRRLLLGGLLSSLALAGCAGRAAVREPMSPDCVGGVCVYRGTPAQVGAICGALFGQARESDGCFELANRTGWESRRGALSPALCEFSSEPEECRERLFSEQPEPAPPAVSVLPLGRSEL